MTSNQLRGLMLAAYAAVGLTAGMLAPGMASAAAFKGVGECTRGRRVTDSSNKTGTVIGTDQGSLCHVQLDGGGSSYYLFWMLHAAGGSAETNDKLVPGRYACYTLESGHLEYTFTDLYITGPATYRSGNQTFGYRLNPQTRQITFLSGPFARHPAKLSDGPSIVVGSTTCDLQKR
jgi:hypothetical protein